MIEIEFDRQIEDLKRNIDFAINNLVILTNPNTTGYDDMQEVYIDDLMKIMRKLVKIKRKL